jgi:hypothetical protein
MITKHAALVASGIAAALLTIGALVPVGAAGSTVEPSSLSRGADPAVPFLVHDVIHDGPARVTATHRGHHQQLWTVDGGYVVQDWLQHQQVSRLVFIGAGVHAGEEKVVGRSPLQLSAAVSPAGNRIAWTRGPNDLTRPTTVSVSNPATGKVIAARTFLWARVLGVTRDRVLLTRRDHLVQEHPTTVWWNHRTRQVRTIADREAVRADVPHDRLVIATGTFDEPAFCNRVASLAHPDRTLWHSCRWAPHAWSPDGDRVLVTHTYFDDVGTDRWLTMRAHGFQRLGQVQGRLDWDAVWEDDQHFLTLALGEDGQAAVVRCSVEGRCERASRLFDVGRATFQPNYIAPPVVLPSN